MSDDGQWIMAKGSNIFGSPMRRADNLPRAKNADRCTHCGGPVEELGRGRCRQCRLARVRARLADDMDEWEPRGSWKTGTGGIR